MNLTMNMRHSIVAALVAHRFDDERRALDAEGNRLAEALYNECFSAADRALMESLPDGWMPLTRHIHVKIGTNWLNNVPMLDTPRRIPAVMGNLAYHLALDHPLADALCDWSARMQDHHANKRTLKNEALQALRAIRTTGRLLKDWPEVQPFLIKAGVTHEKTGNLPAIVPAELNQKLNLPVDAK